jgi:hypothetical protein
MDDIKLEDLRHALVAIDLRDIDPNEFKIIHVVGYQEEISDQSIEEMYAELQSDPEFGMMDLIPHEDYMLVRVLWEDIKDSLNLEDAVDKSLTLH